jgi:hypothetical protein
MDAVGVSGAIMTARCCGLTRINQPGSGQADLGYIAVTHDP